VLVDPDADAPVTDSTDILHYLEAVASEPPLIPDDPTEREQVLQMEEFFDESVARPVALYNYCFLSMRPAAFRAYFSMGLSRRQRFLVALIRPLLPHMLARFRQERDLSPEAAARYRRQLRERPAGRWAAAMWEHHRSSR
jgi:glutathione S-transferase